MSNVQSLNGDRKDIWGGMGRTCREKCKVDGCYTGNVERGKHNHRAITNTIVHIDTL
jgi:hypothetical protein